jgi:hypothetical protein
MDDERIVRKVKPTLVITTSMTIKRWVEEQARLRETTQAEIVNELLRDYMNRTQAEPVAELAAAS